MKPLKQLILFAALALSCVAAAQLEPNSFINRPVHTHEALMKHVQSDPEVMDRYMRHFRMTREQVMHYLGVLRPGRLDKDYACTQYSVPGTGVVKSRQSVVKKGELVLFNAAGVPVLRMKCGNPLLGPEEPPAPTEPVYVSDSPELKELIASTEPVMEDVMAIHQPPVPILPEPIVEVPTEFVPSITPTTSVTEALGLAVFGAGLGLGNGSSDNPPVPEPTSLAVLMVGGAALVARKRKNRR